jgi:hypothetical protein
MSKPRGNGHAAACSVCPSNCVAGIRGGGDGPSQPAGELQIVADDSARKTQSKVQKQKSGGRNAGRPVSKQHHKEKPAK